MLSDRCLLCAPLVTAPACWLLSLTNFNGQSVDMLDPVTGERIEPLIDRLHGGLRT